MNNEWLNTLRSRMDDHEEDVPEGLWDDIKEELFSGEEDHMIAGAIPVSDEQETGKKETGSDARKSFLFYRIGGIAAAITLLFLIIKLLPQENSHKILSRKQQDLKENENRSLENTNDYRDSGTEIKSASADPLVQNGNKPELMVNALDHRSFKNLRNKGTEKSRNFQEITETSTGAELFHHENQISGKEPAPDKTINKPVVEEKRDEVLFKEEKTKELYADDTRNKIAKTQEKKSWMLSMLTGNISSNGAEQQFPGYASISGKPMNIEQIWSTSVFHDDDPLTAILLANQSQPIEARIRHKVPVTFGFSVYYNLGKRWGIGTGLNYTKLSSELHSGSEMNYIKGDQTVHYVGVPVQVNYNVIQKGKFTGYVTGGALVEKPISGSITTTYIVNDEIKETSKERLEHKTLQFSVSSAVGLQLKVIDRLGIYAEPGIGYHFKSEDAPNTIYKEKPLQFNMKFGVRLLLD
ncbi:PorT family protein [Chryseobacterium sp. Tr-659]|uniref:outer membrane beta-barrel protein n=1 Tax=Chryseobacterium sp. Tr-659 TaxID=2608340 RepID=UPI00141DAF4D|nr:outer membrane beta-barrel protein [Chryseobacterium sp. Tr-659]NIF05713.1 PorT family protein [Chryseobacterium sp. Tr-659]